MPLLWCPQQLFGDVGYLAAIGVEGFTHSDGGQEVVLVGDGSSNTCVVEKGAGFDTGGG